MRPAKLNGSGPAPAPVLLGQQDISWQAKVHKLGRKCTLPEVVFS
jgi:hypothetical protein